VKTRTEIKATGNWKPNCTKWRHVDILLGI